VVLVLLVGEFLSYRSRIRKYKIWMRRGERRFRELTDAIPLLIWKSGVPGDATEKRLEEMRQHCNGIAADVQALSHQLHSSRLDYLGLTVALQSFCEEFSEKQNVNVDFKCENVPCPLPKDLSLSLFRIAQEGLHNSL